MEKPVQPNAEDCCNSGCNPCIFDIYEEQLKLYNKYLEGGEIAKISKNNGISQLTYTQFTVVKNTAISNLHYLIKFKKLTLNNEKVWWKPGDHFLFKYTAPETSCTRAYTPVKVRNELSDADDCDFSIIIKKYDDGLVSSFLCNLNEGQLTLWRGPYGHYRLEPNKFNRIFMIAQGTGIAPFITIVDKILNNEDDMTKVILLYCCKTENTILFRDELYAFKSFWNFKYDIFLSSNSNNYVCKYQESIKNHKLSFQYLCNFKPFLGNDQFLVCGSPQFNEAYDVYLRKVPVIENIILF